MVTQVLQTSARLALCASLLYCSGAAAATQGELGSTSSASLEISLTIAPLARVSALQDIRLTTTQGQAATGSSPVCLFANTQGTLSLTATGSGPASAYTLSSDSGDVAYQLSLVDANGSTPVLAGAAVTTNSSTDPSCTDNTTRLQVDVPDTSAPPATYSGILTLLVSPD